jgi:riboflavin biosynthesis pyrimidine reductase
VTVLRLLLPGSAIVGDLDDDRADAVQALADLYAYPDPVPRHGWVRASMITTLDGSAPGPAGPSGASGSGAGRAVFDALRGLADVVLVGAGTVRHEGYQHPTPQVGFAERRAASGQAPAPALAVVTRSGLLPNAAGFAAGAVNYLVTCAAADVAGLRVRFGRERVVVAGEDDVDPLLAAAQLAARGLPRILLEGGPTLLGGFEAAGRVDELCLTISPLLVAGPGPRIALGGRPALLRLRPAHLIESDGALLGRWLVQPT